MTPPPGRAAARRPMTWSLLGLVAAVNLGTLVLLVAPRSGAQPLLVHDPLGFLSGIAIAVGYAVVFAVLVARQPDNPVAWIFGAVALVASVSEGSWTYVSFATDVSPARVAAPEVVGWLNGLTIPAWTSLMTMLALVFPDGRLLSPAWRRLVKAQLAMAAVAAVAIALAPGPIPLVGVANPFAVAGPAGQRLAALRPVALLGAALLFLPGAWSVVLRYRLADRVGRLQLKWFVYAAFVFAVVGLAFLVLGDSAVASAGTAGSAVWLAFAAAATFVPVAAMIAILRYRLYEIDRIIGRTFVYGALVAILAGLYSAAIQLFTWFFKEITGQASDGALVVTTLVLATTFTPIKGRLERVAATRLKEPVEVPTPNTPGLALDLDDPSVQAFAVSVAAMVRKELDADRSV